MTAASRHAWRRTPVRRRLVILDATEYEIAQAEVEALGKR